jgi:glycosyltransferase involved in cell wall biosynthesis
LELSIVIPSFNEEESVSPLWERIKEASNSFPVKEFEVIFIDDGSSDNTWAEIEKLSDLEPRVKGLKLRRNFGKATALSEGFSRASAEIIVTMDSDLQDDPDDIPNLLAKLDEGFDLVSGWKKVRNDPLSKTMPSRLFNYATTKITGVPIHDINCGLKAYRADVLRAINVYGELHRYIPVLAHGLGFRVIDIPTLNHARPYGVSKYGIERFVRGMLDLLTVIAITRFSARPGHLFGGIGVVLGLLGNVGLGYLFVAKLFGELIGDRPLLLVSVMAVIVSVQFIFFGLLAEIMLHRDQREVRYILTSDEVGQLRNPSTYGDEIPAKAH